jgi:signal transduction histidine kinase
MQETIYISIVILSLIFIVITIGLVLILIRYYQSKEKHNKELYSSIIQAQEKERERLSRDVHDELGGLITSSRLSLASIYIDDKDDETKEKIDHISKVLEMASISARNAALELSPVEIKNYGLKGAIQMFPNLYQSYHGVFDIKCEIPALNPSLEISLFRIISEIINNSIKYSRAKYIYATIFIDDSDNLNIKIGDNGVGFDLNTISNKSNGIKNIENRCKVLNGKFSIKTTEGCHYHLTFKKSDYDKR